MVSKLFGSKPKTSPSQSGFNALPDEIQDRFVQLANTGSRLIRDPSRYFAPIDLTAGERQAQDLINLYQDPQAFQQNIRGFLNPFRDIVTQDINRAFEDQYGGLSRQASEAGAFGGSRYRQAAGDLERARLDAIANATAGQYNTALGQQQQVIGNLLGFGGLERGIDLQQRGALPAAISTYSSALAPLLQTNTGESTTAGKEGLVSKVGKVAGLAGSIAGLFSERKLKTNIKKIGEKFGLNVYEYEYLWSPQKFIGYMADEVEKLYPEAIGERLGYKTANYGMING